MGEGASENVIEKLHIVKTAKLAGIIPMIIRYSLFFFMTRSIFMEI